MDPVDISYDLYHHSFVRIKDRSNPLELFDETEFKVRFRLSKQLFLDLLDELMLERSTKRSHPIPPVVQLCVTLQFYATGMYQHVLGDLRDLSQSSVSRIIRDTSQAIADLSRRYITFPQTTAEKLHVCREFRNKMRIPSIIGAIDCTHIRIKNPSDRGVVFINRKGYASINVQMIATHDNIIEDIVARYPGSAHDSRIFLNSRVRRRLEGGDLHGSLIIGDQGYGCSQVLLTPVRYPRTPGEEAYNRHFIQARGSIERTFGILKSRFSVLGADSRIRLKCETTAVVVVACAVLHNMCLRRGLNHTEDIPENLEDFNQGSRLNFQSFSGSSLRTTLIQRFFSN